MERLILKFAIPSVTALLVSSLYNSVYRSGDGGFRKCRHQCGVFHHGNRSGNRAPVWRRVRDLGLVGVLKEKTLIKRNDP